MTTAPTFDKRHLRGVFGTFVTGVTVITTRDAAGRAHGVTANSFSSVSLDPPLVSWSQSLTARSHFAFRDSDHFVVNIMAADQAAIADHFAKSQDDKFAAVAFHDNERGVPILEGCVAHLECSKVATYPGGDHAIFLGRVDRASHSDGAALAFERSRYVRTLPFN